MLFDSYGRVDLTLYKSQVKELIFTVLRYGYYILSDLESWREW